MQYRHTCAGLWGSVSPFGLDALCFWRQTMADWPRVECALQANPTFVAFRVAAEDIGPKPDVGGMDMRMRLLAV